MSIDPVHFDLSLSMEGIVLAWHVFLGQAGGGVELIALDNSVIE